MQALKDYWVGWENMRDNVFINLSKDVWDFVSF